jgi:Saxitoxin biosynthesis operon protein SxtJ
MALIRINQNPSRTQLNVFGAAWLIFFGVWGGIAAAHDHAATARVLWTLAGVIPLVGWFFPRGLRLVYLALSYATYPIGFVVSHVVLALIYYLVFTPVGLIMKLFRYDPLARHFEAQTASYWKPRTNPKPVASYFRQD